MTPTSTLNQRGTGRRRRRIPGRVICFLAIFAFIGQFVPLSGLLGLPSANGSTVPSPAIQNEEAPGTAEESSSDAEGSAAVDEQTEDDHAGGHADPVAEVLLAIVIILLMARLTGDIFERVGMPAVLGELSIGVVLGNWAFITGTNLFPFFDPSTHTGEYIDILARIGVVLLLFEVGLESRVREMLSVGTSSLLVAILGVVAPIILGFLAGLWIASEWEIAAWQVPAFLGATLCATSVGITARVLKDLGRSQDRESRIILGAAVIDDVLGLVVLAVVTGVISQGENFEVLSIFKTIGLSIGFLAVALGLGALQLPRYLFKAASYLRGHGLLVATALVICFGFAWAANLVQLAPIIGAFAAGLILEGAHYQDAGERWRNHRLEDALAPLSALLVPIFFVGMGLNVDVRSFGDPSVWLLAGVLTIAAIIGKQVCSLGVREKGLNKLAVGLGMIPRGEVGLIFANEGKRLRTPAGEEVVSAGTYSAIVVMVIITTMVTPPLLKWSMSRKSKLAVSTSRGGRGPGGSSDNDDDGDGSPPVAPAPDDATQRETITV